MTVFNNTNAPKVNTSGDLLVLNSAEAGTQIDIRKNLKKDAGRILVTFSGSGSQSIMLTINPAVRVLKRNVEKADEIVTSFANPHTIEYQVSVTAPATWDSNSVFGKLPIHSFEIDSFNVATSVDVICIPFPLS
jgi:hypothetical protein